MRLDTLKEQDIRTRCETSLQKLKDLQPKLNAIVTFVDIEEQLEGLKQIAPDAPLYGMPIVLKDNISTNGIRTTASSRILDNYVPVYDAAIVEKLKAAGAIIIAKASMDELGMGGTNKNAYTGKVSNPYDLDRISGGSSGGRRRQCGGRRGSGLHRYRYRRQRAKASGIQWHHRGQADVWPHQPLWHHPLCVKS